MRNTIRFNNTSKMTIRQPLWTWKTLMPRMWTVNCATNLQHAVVKSGITKANGYLHPQLHANPQNGYFFNATRLKYIMAAIFHPVYNLLHYFMAPEGSVIKYATKRERCIRYVGFSTRCQTFWKFTSAYYNL